MMKKINICLLIRFFFIMLTIVSATGICTADTTLPAFPEMFQEHGNWCWAGTSEAVIEYYGTSVTQCAIANWSWGRSDCCGNTDLYWSHPCNQPQWNYGRSGSSQDILQNWGVNSNGLATYLLWPTAVSEINAGRPFVMRFAWIPEGGHALDGYGYDDQTGTANDYLLYMDPWPGNGYTKSLYTWVVSAADHNWTHTLQITTNPTKPSTENPNLTPYQPEGWTDKIVVSKTTGTNTDSSPLYTTDILYVDWAVINNGSVVTPTGYTVALYVDSVLKATWSAPPLDVNYYHFGYDYSIGSLAVGTHTIKIVADSTGVISESIEGDNEYTKTITVENLNLTPYQPEGWTDKIVVSKTTGTNTDSSPLYTTDILYVDWAVINNGSVVTPTGFTVALYVDSVLETIWSPAPLDVNYYVPVYDYSIGSLAVGTHTIKIVADSTGVISESIEGDNEYTKTITVQNLNLTPYQPEGWSDKIVVSKTTGTNTDSSPLYTTDILYVDWAVINNGSVVTPTGFTVALYVDSVLETIWSPAPLDVNYYVPVYDYSIGSLAVGTHTIKIVADSTGVISESIEGDNEYTKTITVVSQTEGTFGTEWTITGSGFGTKKGKVLIGSTLVTIIDWADGLIHCRLAKVRAPGVYDVTIQPIGPQGTPSIIVKDGFTVKAAEVHSIDVGSGSAYDQVTITGKFFGTKKGAVYLEYGEGEYLKRKSCKVSSWTMEPTTGDSEIVFVVPKMLPEVCDVVVDPYGTIPDAEDEEEHGFTVKAPEIVSITPNSGSVGEQITISGNFFGSKKPKVYLGYVSNGKPTKKSCSVVSWSDDEIIFTLPKFPLGTYDVIVTNSVSSDTLPGGFIIK